MKLVKEIIGKSVIPGAAYDSPERRHPPRCPPLIQGDLRAEIWLWMHEPVRRIKILWLNGGDRVGKSGITQTIVATEPRWGDPMFCATAFLSNSDNPAHVLSTIAGQLAAKCPKYREYLKQLLVHAHRRLPEGSLEQQFEGYFTKPYARSGRKLFKPLDIVTILIDGLDHCQNPLAQGKLIHLVDEFVRRFPEAPFLWFISSRREHHIEIAFREIRSPFLEKRVDNDPNLRSQHWTTSPNSPTVDSSHRCPPQRWDRYVKTHLLDNVFKRLSQKQKVLWLHGNEDAARSAIVRWLEQGDPEKVSHQSVSYALGATLFFSGPITPQVVITTIQSQLSNKYRLYKKCLKKLNSNDPRISESPLDEQFKRLIATPWSEQTLSGGTNETVLIILDGLDRSMSWKDFADFIQLICAFTSVHTSTPLTFVITSHWSRHLDKSFAQFNGHYSKISVPVDALDIARYVEDHFPTAGGNQSQPIATPGEIARIVKGVSMSLPLASTMMKFIFEFPHGDRRGRLNMILKLIDSPDFPNPQDDPYLCLKPLYAMILSSIPQRIFQCTERLLAQLLPWRSNNYLLTCNCLNISQMDADEVLRGLAPFVNTPPPEQPSSMPVTAIHPYFNDYLRDEASIGQWAAEEAFEASVRVLRESGAQGRLVPLYELVLTNGTRAYF